MKFNSHKEFYDCKKAIENLLLKGAIKKCKPCPGQFLSSYFLIPKSDGTNRVILNLKELNTFIDTEHFKMEDIRTATYLISKISIWPY